MAESDSRPPIIGRRCGVQYLKQLKLLDRKEIVCFLFTTTEELSEYLLTSLFCLWYKTQVIFSLLSYVCFLPRTTEGLLFIHLILCLKPSSSRQCRLDTVYVSDDARKDTTEGKKYFISLKKTFLVIHFWGESFISVLRFCFHSH